MNGGSINYIGHVYVALTMTTLYLRVLQFLLGMLFSLIADLGILQCSFISTGDYMVNLGSKRVDRCRNSSPPGTVCQRVGQRQTNRLRELRGNVAWIPRRCWGY